MGRSCRLEVARFVPAIKFLRSPSGCTKVFFRKNIFRESKKMLCDFSFGMELENEKNGSVNENENNKNKNVDAAREATFVE